MCRHDCCDTAGPAAPGKRSVTVVAEHLVPSEIGEVEVDAAVVVEVAGRHPHAISTRVDPALLGHIREMQRARPVGVHLQVISVEATLERERTLRWEERLTER